MTAPWPQDRTDTLIRLWNGGSSSGEIARQLGSTFGLKCTRSMVMGKVSRLRLLRHARLVSYSPKVSKPKPKPKPKDKKPPAPIKPQEPAPCLATCPVPFIEADHTTCKWPLWNGGRTGNCCGARPVPAAPYCPYHYDKAFTGLWSRRKTA